MNTKKATPSASAEVVALYDKLVKTNPKVERKGATVPNTTINGHMFSFVYRDGTVQLRLQEDKRTAFLKKYKASITKAYGAVMKEWVTVPPGLLKKTSELKPYFEASYRYAKSLKPK